MARFVWNAEATLDSDAYADDFQAYFDDCRNSFKKIEYGQTFLEPGNESWEAFNAGDWRKALSLANSRDEEARRYFDALKNSGMEAKRVRLICEPLTGYLVWELNILIGNIELGEQISVLPLRRAEKLVDPAWLDDYVAIDETVAYRVLYNEAGLNAGGERSKDQESIRSVIHAFNLLESQGECLTAYFSREVAHLVP